LKRTTNLDIIQYPGASASVGMRGFPPSAHNRNYTLVLIDGKPAGTTNLSSIPSDFVQRIEVVKGPYSFCMALMQWVALSYRHKKGPTNQTARQA
jgi:vitamin B12 transporter